jgi:glucose/arabinose dehydrogenase
VSPVVLAGERTRIELPAPASGEYTFMCTIHPHEMIGTLVVGASDGRAAATPRSAPAPPPLAEHPALVGAELAVTTFAWGLPYPTAMLELDDGDLLVAVNESADAAFIGSTAKLLRLADDDGDGIAERTSPVGVVGPAGADGPPVLKELPGAVVQMRRLGDLVVMAIRDRAISHLVFLRDEIETNGYLAQLGRITLDFPRDHVHKTYGLALRPGAADGSAELFFNVGSRLNDESDTTPVPVRGLLKGVLRPESIHRITITHDGSRASASDLRLVATGVRNAAGMALHLTTGDLYFQDNGINLDDGSESQLSADEIDVIPADALDMRVTDFGFPHSYVDAASGQLVGDPAQAPLVAILPLEGSEAEGAAEITFAPPEFLAGLDSGLFVGFHGRYHLAGIENDENPVHYVDIDEPALYAFVPNDAPDLGHIDNLLATTDALYLADMSRFGPVGVPNAEGAIYKVSARAADSYP